MIGPSTNPADFGKPNYIYGGTEVISVGDPGTLYVYHNSGSGGDLMLNATTKGFLLILGIPNDTSNGGNGGNFFNGVNPITSGNGSLGGPDLFGGHWNHSVSGDESGFAGLMPSQTTGTNAAFSGNEAYSVANLNGANNSNNFLPNWQGADANAIVNGQPLGVTANNFGLYVFEIDATISGSSRFVPITFNPGSLPLGIMIIGYGTTDPSYPTSGSNPLATAFTQAGMETSGGTGPNITTVPAPSSVVLLGFGGFGLVIILSRSGRRLAAA